MACGSAYNPRPLSPPLSFEIFAHDAASRARVGRVTTPHGAFDTPAFMPVGTQGTVKGLLPGSVRDTGAQIILGNTYHLLLRPGAESVAALGGLQKWTRWQGPMLTDSGGFQVFSLANINKMSEEGVRFRSHIDGKEINLTPEESIRVQNLLGADIIMAFDDCPPARTPKPKWAGPGMNNAAPSKQFRTEKKERELKALEARPLPVTDEREYLRRVREANERTLRWLDRCFAAHARKDEQALFPICQGGTDLEMRAWCAGQLVQREAYGYAIGGVAVGEGSAEIRKVVEFTAPLLPAHKPRYLMGVGYERDIVAAVRAGVDMFDCVLPTRNGRNAQVFTRNGPMKLRNAQFAADPRPIDDTCSCACCAGGYSRAYLRHLFMANEMLGPILLSIHNIHHFQRLMLDIRRAIRDNAWPAFADHWPVAELAPVDSSVS